MKFKVCSLLLILSMGIQDAWSQSAMIPLDTQWRNVQALVSGVPVKIRRVAGKSVDGTVVMVTDDAITASTKKGTLTVPRQDIREVKVQSESQRQKNAFVGAAVGGISGVVAAAIAGGALTDGNGMSGEAAALFGTVGALSGFVIRIVRPGYRTIYKVRR